MTRASTAHPSESQAFPDYNAEESLQLLAAISREKLGSENYEELEQAMTRVLGWLHRQIVASLLANTQTGHIKLVRIQQLFCHWHKLQQATDKPMSSRLWILWVELGCKLAVLHCCEAKEMIFFFQMLTTTNLPRDFPIVETNFDTEKQVAFSCEIWDSVIVKPLSGVAKNILEMVMLGLLEIFLHWMTHAMRGYETIFIANVATPYREHVQASLMDNLQLADACLKVATCKLETNDIMNNAANISLKALILSALSKTLKSVEAVRCLEILSAATAEELSRRTFPKPQDPIACVGLALGIAYLDDARHSCILKMTGNATLLCYFAFLRLVSLQMLSLRVNSYDDIAIADYQAYIQQILQALFLEHPDVELQESSLRIMENCIESMIEFFQSSRQIYLSLIDALRAVLPPNLFLPEVIRQLQSTDNVAVHNKNVLTFDIVAFIKQFYKRIAPLLEVFSTRYLVRSFLALSRMEFIREVCASPIANVSMQAVTQQLKLKLEQSTTPSESIFAPIFHSLSRRSVRIISFETDIVAGCQTLAVGLVVQQKLRILLLRCASLINEALALVYSCLYNVFEPVDAFAHRFLGVCLSHPGQFFPLFTVFPYYLEVTLASYPITASRQALIRVCGAVFGSLFDSEELMMPSKQQNDYTKSAQRMALWAIRKCVDRCNKLLIKENRLSTTLKVDNNPEIPTGDKQPTGNACTSAVANTTSDSDGLYLAGLVFELLKMAPMNILEACAREIEQLFVHWDSNSHILHQLKYALFAKISQNCEAENRAWLAAWYLEIDRQYPLMTVSFEAVATSRL